ncbi:MAG: DNA polymerase III subunit alpha [Erysipelotrichaceae bacterium]|nr:DNA polymerase III subunit alpha [Erysipelotrichaceae bacterium]
MSIHLHVRSSYTLLESTLTVSKIVDFTLRYGYRAVALTDKNVMHGAMAFHHACKKKGIKAIFGLEVDCEEEGVQYSFILLARNDQGYQSLLKLSTYLNTQKEKLSLQQLTSYTSDCVVLTSRNQSSLETYLLNEDVSKMKAYIQKCQLSFPLFYVSISENDSGLLHIKNKVLKKLCQEISARTVALSRIYFGEKEDEESYKTLCAIQQGLSIHDKMLNYSSRRYYRSKEEMAQLYDEDDLQATEEIADLCNVTFDLKKATLPHFQNKFSVSSAEYLKQLCHKGLAKRMQFQTIPQVYIDRLNYELSVIINMHYEDYFLIVWDFIRFAKTQGIYIGPGRGSAAGSLVAYCLGITHADPIKYNLLFERFLNPERISMPDIDTDFPDNRRDEVIRYVRSLYGERRVAHILTFNTLAAKQVLRDVGRAMQINARQVDMLCKQVPNLVKVTLQYAYDHNPRFNQMVNSSKELRELFAISLRLEGLPRHISQHAAGVILSNDDIEEVCPLIEVDDGVLATQFTMEYLEELGLIKMDFLGLRNLTIVDDIVQRINQTREKKLDILHIPLDDKKTFQMLQNVNTIGIFQLESEGIQNLIRQMKPRNFEEIVATIALYRPGPMDNIPEYLKRRDHPELVDYIHPKLKDILHNTYGIMIYQEQIMQIAQVLSGFSLAKADNLRKAISKKQEKELKQLEDDFINGAISLGYEKELAYKVYNLIMKFANYGFNRSHSVAYGMLAYQMAFLKANAPLYFFSSLLDSVIGTEIKTSIYILEAKKCNIKILLPSVNVSSNRYKIEGNALRYPLTGIKNIGVNVCHTILEERDKNGKFEDFFAFVARVSSKKVNRKNIESLIYAGALDEFSMNRSSMIASLEDALRYADLVKIEDENQIMINFDLVSKPVPIMVKENKMLQNEKEKEVIGFYLSDHPIYELRQKIDPSLKCLANLRKYTSGYVKFLCQIEKTKTHHTKNNELMLFVGVLDETGKFDLACMPNIYKRYGDILVKGNYLLVEGRIDRENSCLVKKLKKIDMQDYTVSKKV